MFEPRAETLWDIEIEKENVENHKNEIRRRRDDTMANKNILPAISSTGVLLPTLSNKSNTIDFVFVLNVRESESFPPLLTQADVQCAEDKMALLGASTGYQNEAMDWKSTFLKECINNRIAYDQQQSESVMNAQKPSYETQITVIRLSISCTCNDLNANNNEVCSSFASQQRWTEYMGNRLDGTYNV